MAEKVDLSLDDIIKMNKNKNQRQARKGVVKKTGNGGNSGMKPRKRLQNLGARSAKIIGNTNKGGPKTLSPNKRESAMLHVSNLHFNVSNEDIRELFAEVGMIRKAAVHYDKSGRSLGTAEVIYSHRDAALKAIKKYHGLPLDGRPMNISLVPSQTNVGIEKRKPQGIFKKPKNTNQNVRRNGQPNKKPQLSSRRPNVRGKNPSRREPKKQVTAEQLDADLEAYNESQNAMQ